MSQFFFSPTLKPSDFQLYSAGLHTAFLGGKRSHPCKPFCMQVWSPSHAFTVFLLNWLGSLILTFIRLISCLGHFSIFLSNSFVFLCPLFIHCADQLVPRLCTAPDLFLVFCSVAWECAGVSGSSDLGQGLGRMLITWVFFLPSISSV